MLVTPVHYILPYTTRQNPTSSTMPTLSVPIHDVLSHCRTLLDIASAIPVPGLKSGFAIAAKIIEDVEVRRELCCFSPF
jgi:hypothetical protein